MCSTARGHLDGDAGSRRSLVPRLSYPLRRLCLPAPLHSFSSRRFLPASTGRGRSSRPSFDEIAGPLSRWESRGAPRVGSWMVAHAGVHLGGCDAGRAHGRQWVQAPAVSSPAYGRGPSCPWPPAGTSGVTERAPLADSGPRVPRRGARVLLPHVTSPRRADPFDQLEPPKLPNIAWIDEPSAESGDARKASWNVCHRA